MLRLAAVYRRGIYLMCLVLIAFGVLSWLGWQRRQPEDTGSRDATITDYPFMTALVLGRDMTIAMEGTYPQGQRWCGGTLIAKRWVLTAAHCIRDAPFASFGITEDNLGVMLGQTQIINQTADPRSIISVTRIIIHPAFQANTKQSDLALLKLAPYQPWPTDASIKPIRPVRRSVADQAGRKATVLGWGEIGRVHPFPKNASALQPPTTFPETLQKMQAVIMARDACQAAYDTPNGIYLLYKGMLCAQNPKPTAKDACDGDSGGPLLVNINPWWQRGWFSAPRWRVAGLVSWGLGCGAGYPGVYTDISLYREWITATIRPRWPLLHWGWVGLIGVFAEVIVLLWFKRRLFIGLQSPNST